MAPSRGERDVTTRAGGGISTIRRFPPSPAASHAARRGAALAPRRAHAQINRRFSTHRLI